MRTGWGYSSDPGEEIRRRVKAMRERQDVMRRMKYLEREGDAPGVLIDGTCVDVTEGAKV